MSTASKFVNIPDENLPVVFEARAISVLPAPPRIDLSNARDVRREMAAIYRAMKEQKLDENRGAKLVYVLQQVGQLIKVQENEERIDALERIIGTRRNTK